MQTGKNLSLVKSILPVVGKTLPIFVIFSMIGQCISNANLTTKLDRLASRNIPVQIGQDRQMVMGKKVTEDENREQFIAEIISSFSWVKRTTAEFQSTCKEIAKQERSVKLFKQCESGIDPGAITPYGKFTSAAYAYQHLVAPESQEPVMKWILSFKPKNFDEAKSQDSRTIKVTKIGVSEEFKEGKNGNEMRTPIEIEFTESVGSVDTRKFSKYYWIYTREFLRPTANGAKNPYNVAVTFSQQRGLYLTRILPYTNTSF
jgi:hypothetical protein